MWDSFWLWMINHHIYQSAVILFIVCFGLFYLLKVSKFSFRAVEEIERHKIR